jgi:hypothetical protein
MAERRNEASERVRFRRRERGAGRGAGCEETAAAAAAGGVHGRPRVDVVVRCARDIHECSNAMRDEDEMGVVSDRKRWAGVDSERVKQIGMGRRRTWCAAGRLGAARKRPRRVGRRMWKVLPRRQRHLQCPSVRVLAYGLGGGQRGRERAEVGVERAVGAHEDVFKGIRSSESLGVRERRRVRSRGRKQRGCDRPERAVRGRLPDVGPCGPSTTAPKAAVPHFTYYVFLTEDLALSPSPDACRHSPRRRVASQIHFIRWRRLPYIIHLRLSVASLTRC